ncbi:MAG: hypothetical protein LIO74_00385 [Ruminococcus sp.]|nr:hypothetical protein [Ruminococcus sp.]
MVKGVNKKIIEINHPDSLYFDRAVFYLKPDVTEFSPQLSQADANMLLSEVSPKDLSKRRYGWIRTLVLIMLSCIGTVLLCKIL